MRVVITGGGTGGHTSAGLAVAAALGRHGVECAWIGSRTGIEARRVPEAGLPYHAIPTGKLRRYWDWQNFPDLLLRVPAGLVQARRLLRQVGPNLLFATGGFVALPAVMAARGLGIPIVVHEQTSSPGLANRIAGRVAQRIALTFPQSGTEFPPDKVVVTGNPLRPELAGGSREAGIARLGLDPALPVIYVTGGAQGSQRINRTVGAILAPLLEVSQVIHQCGDNPETADRHWLEEHATSLPPQLRSRYHLIAYVGSELRDVYAVVSLVVGRAGAGTVNECCQLGLPALYIPLPGTRGDEQTANARLVQAAGGAMLFPQVALTPRGLLQGIRGLLADPPRLKAMGEQARSLAVPDAAERIVALIVEVASP
ncbi:MAG: undecaprenyldiphospho-muramoylpentapeptide beta-N-acetylglucosaminyltransferase [Candidatus Rokubacteria bacterium]|nr:undecaprenyldiphospho-muramoylpentapeptide beta-N-acetylglucosaminyltransferase [Candidatus Rokubacteria bacterium]